MLPVALKLGNWPAAPVSGAMPVMSSNRVTAPASPLNIADNTVEPVFYADVRASYEFEVSGANLEVWGSITNLFDKDPPATGTFSTFTGASTQYNAALFDVLGRRYTMGVRLRM